ncbi:hypothetical protein BGZ63DRAFT_421056 [Mariannaea sp. PMI_226]|nr:hypothetical protein BGZ63DRAFT_421056 [Mariannaea sp. PMI_226]
MLVLEGHPPPEPCARASHGNQPYWSEELQLLYNRWRDSVYFQEFDNFLQDKDKGGSLTVPSLGRSLSVSSGDSSSSAPSAEEDESPEQDQKPRRRGPLSKSKREKTAFIRRLGACSSCRSRKVGCKHWDLSEFEDWFQRSKEYERQLALNGLQLSESIELASLPHQAANLTYGMEPQKPPEQWQAPVAADFTGQLHTHVVSANQATQFIEPVNPSLQPSLHCGVSRAESPICRTKLVPTGQFIAIGNDLALPGNGPRLWQCLAGNHDSWLWRGLNHSCSGQFESVGELMGHILTDHRSITPDRSQIWFKCSSCGQLNADYHYCLQCEEVAGQEQWIYGYDFLHC